MNYPQHVTMVDDLPELDDLAGMGRYPSGPMQGGPNFSGVRGPQINLHDISPDVGKFIRGHHIPPSDSGMVGPHRPTPHNLTGGGYNKYGAAYNPQIGPGPHLANNFYQQEPQQQVLNEDINPYPYANSQNVYEIEGYENKNYMGNCLDVSNHVENCPICRKLYKNDKTVMIIVIVILAILCLLLLKKVLNL